MIYVTKATGEREPFSEEKVRQSIIRAGIPESLRSQVLEHIKSKLVQNISTTEIYRHIIDFFDETENYYEKARYSLKQSLMQMGPSGYPFEDYIAQILNAKGYTTQVRQILMGKCVSHEIDVVLEKDGLKASLEAKFHNSPGIRSDIQTALYSHARFEDIKEKNNLHEAWLVTNTKATVDAISYAKCVSMNIISWSYPEQGSLRELIDETKLYPLTVLTTLSNGQKRILLDHHTVTCLEIYGNHSLLHPLFLPETEKKRILQEIKAVCKIT